MKISDAQQEVRSVYLGAFTGLIVTGLIWLLSAAVGTWMSTGLANLGAGARRHVYLSFIAVAA
jgi:hypothetical protein